MGAHENDPDERAGDDVRVRPGRNLTAVARPEEGATPKIEDSYLYGPGGLPVEQVNGEEKAQYLHHDQPERDGRDLRALASQKRGVRPAE